MRLRDVVITVAASERLIYVYESWSSAMPILLGRLFLNFLRRQETFAFEYDQTWLHGNPHALVLDPNLAM